MHKIVLCILMLAALSGCGMKTEVPVETKMSGMPNPIKQVEDAKAFEALGIYIVLPEDVEEVHYSTISETTAQAKFQWKDADFTYRGAETDKDITGVYEERKEDAVLENVEVEGESTEVTIQTTVNEGKIALWTWGEIQYSLYTGDKIEETSFVELARILAASSFVKG